MMPRELSDRGGQKVKRRDFITLLGGAAAAWPLAAGAQQKAIPVIGYLGEAPELSADRLRALWQGLNETGYVEGRNVLIEYGWAQGRYDRYPALAAELVRRQVSVIVTSGVAAMAAKAATTTIPIVFTTGGDPVAYGLVASLNRPGGNVTGVTSLTAEVAPKRLELMHELIPAATVIDLLVNPASPPAETSIRDLEAAARALGLQVHVLRASSERDLETVFAMLDQSPARPLIIDADGFFISHIEQIAALTVRYGVPAIYAYREFAAAGGLMSYGGLSNTDMHRQAGVYCGRILKGEKPGDLPVQQATKVQLIINLKTAKALGLTMPITLLGRADEVIE
jgi:putative ABC transport system substrate-binding protein